RNDDIDLQPNELVCQSGQTLGVSLGPAILDREIAALSPAQFAYSLHECCGPLALCRGGSRPQQPDGRRLSPWLRARRERPRCCRRTAEQRDQLAAFQTIELHSISDQPEANCRISNWQGRVSGRRNNFATAHRLTRWAYDWFGSFASLRRAARLRRMSAMPPIATELLCRSELSLSATTGLMHRSKFHSITSSARIRNDSWIVRPRALAALRLITSSYLVGACTGRSACLSPLRMRSTYDAARTY